MNKAWFKIIPRCTAVEYIKEWLADPKGTPDYMIFAPSRGYADDMANAIAIDLNIPTAVLGPNSYPKDLKLKRDTSGEYFVVTVNRKVCEE